MAGASKLLQVAAGLFLLGFTTRLPAKEIPRGFVLPVEKGQGFRTSESIDNPLYLAFFRIQPMYHFLNNRLRLGATLGPVYANPAVDWLAGPRITVRLKSFQPKNLGEAVSLMLCADAQWGTRQRKLWSGGLAFESHPLVFSLRGHHEYEHKEFWLEGSFGVNVDAFFKKKQRDPFDD